MIQVMAVIAIALTIALVADVPAQSADQPQAETPPPDTVQVALLQMDSVVDDMDASLKKADEFCRKAAAMGADIALMPEMWSIGYMDYPGTTREEHHMWTAKAISRDSDYIRHFQSLAKELKMAIVVTYLEEWPKAPRNSATLIDRHGKQLFTYAKVHTCEFGRQESACTPGDGFHVAELDTAKGQVNVGIMICYDREFPESARVLMLKGAELILTPNACGLNDMRISQFQVRAYENAVAVAMANYSDSPCDGNSVAFDEKARLLVRAQGEEGVFLAPIYLGQLRDHQKKTIHGGAFRRPHKYCQIVDTSVLPAFRRENGFGEKFVPGER